MLNTTITYAVALLIMLSSFVAQAGETYNVTVYNKPVQIAVSNSSKAMTKKVLAELKKEMNTILADADSAKYLVDEDNLVLEVRDTNGERKITINLGFQVNAKNRMGAYVGYERICVFTTKSGLIANIGFVGDDLFGVCQEHMSAVADAIAKGI